jgi:pimeloyl-ACP methyl ester carboxylesterase
VPQLLVNQQRLYYEDLGQGLPVVLLHHATASSRSWRRQVPLLAQRFRVITYDRPGFGRSPALMPWPQDYLDHDVLDLVAMLDGLDIEQASLVGHSDGATIALLAAARHPERVRCVVAEAPHVFVDRTTCPAAVAEFQALVRCSPTLQAALARDHGERALAVIDRWADRWLDPAFWSWNVAGELSQVTCPVLVIHGQQDEYFPVEHAEAVAQGVGNGQLWLVPGAGHMPHGEAAQAFNQRLLAFLLSAGPVGVA